MSAAKHVAYRPPWLLRNAHVQSTLASSGVRRVLLRGRAGQLERDARELILDAGDGVRLQGFYTRQNAQPRKRAVWRSCSTVGKAACVPLICCRPADACCAKVGTCSG